MGRVKIGHWGGRGGQPRDVQHSPSRLVRVIVYSKGTAINGIAFTYADTNGQLQDEGPWGGVDDDTPEQDIELGRSGYLKEISGTSGPVGNMSNIITSLKFVTNTGKTYSIGKPSGASFTIPMQEGNIISFFGRAGDYLDALGIYCA